MDDKAVAEAARAFIAAADAYNRHDWEYPLDARGSDQRMDTQREAEETLRRAVYAEPTT